MKTHRSSHHRRAGFTLVELLTVLAVMSVIALGTVSMMQGVLDAQNIQGAASMVKGQLELARQAAITVDQPVQCRFYQAASNNGYYAFKAVYDSTQAPATHLVYLPGKIVITNNTTYSSLNQATALSSGTDTTGTYIAFRFRVDGSTDLDPTIAYTMTVLSGRSSATVTALPKNFITLELNPVTGKTKSFQP